ncbi:protein-export membrane protein SecD [Candidatus Collierbacteria bacterium RIFCSPLOWO2_01_FULL_50_23]|uniref:Protein translocase subunit SecD n=1 Tax=Candidatus Collierbacteria bacterium RIFCSPHIGHO2_01_FULL_50_25 TaxID=1817722 RepID=A0A1F5EXU9_9BACT|nr:MAG: protein-export membrane protein SecD [Candidatus Collierbacteria bacterium RIFCSPHIGHO2_01_FULL_50_25]OGD74145.1 MAG: protein-export membrane protein SecD [Candidatus Collierbacteria bacterium RIFCSPLOWO2_01_FULL_50_23]
MRQSQSVLYFIIFISVLFSYLNLPSDLKFSRKVMGKEFSFTLPRPRVNFKIGNWPSDPELNFKKGLDLQGGMQVTLLANMDRIDKGQRQTALDSVSSVISRRVDLYGVSEASVKTSLINDQYRLVVELPGIDKPQEALSLIGQTASLSFATPLYQTNPASPSAEPTLVDFIPSDLTGNDLSSAAVTFETDDRQPAVSLKFKDSGRDKFAKLTKAFLGKPIAILLDQSILSAPTVQSEITTGDAIITGKFTIDEAKFLATQLNAGALPVPIEILSQKNISATLGDASLNQSLMAGGIGLAIVIVFMCLYYGWMGFISVLGLLIYGLITATIYRLIPVTLTLPGIAGFILSVGMAVDSNILIFERYREEVRTGRSHPVALELSFGRAWNSIKDANLATVITGLILFNPLDWSFLNTSGAVRGFALTLLLGILISLFTGIVVTRTLLRFFYKGAKQ